MRDEELRRIISEIDSALDVLRVSRGEELDPGDIKIRNLIAELRRDLAVYRAVSETQAREKSS